MDHADAIPAEETLLEHAAFLTRLARGLLRDEHAAEDVVQDTFVRAMERPPRPGNRPAWLARVTRNLARSRLRAESRRRRREAEVARREGLPPAGEAVARIELQRRAVEAVLSLPEPYRSTLVHRYFHDLSVDEIAARGDLPRETVRTRLRRALGKLRARLDADHGGDRRAWSVLLLPLLAPRSGPAGLATGGALIVKKAAAVLVVLLVAVAGFGVWRALSSTDGGGPPPPAPAPAVAANEAGPAPATEEPVLPAPVDVAQVDRDRDVFGVLVDEDGNPVAGAAVESVRRPGRRYTELIPSFVETVPGPGTTTASDGSFSLRFERGQTADLTVRADGFPPLVRHGCPAGGRLRLVLRRGRPFAVRVEDAEGRPVTGAEVRIVENLMGGRYDEAPSGTNRLAGGTTGADGTLVLGSAAPGTRAALIVWKAGSGATVTDSTQLPAEGPATVVLPEGETASGVVVDAGSGAPVAGATLDLLPIPLGPRVTTDRDGRFVWPGWSGGLQKQGLVFVSAEGYALTPARMAESIEISHGGTVTGRLVSADGAPIAGAKVAALGEGAGGLPDVVEARADDEGRFSLGGLSPADGHAVIFLKPGFGRAVFDLDAIPLGGRKDLGTVVLPAGRRLEGRVLDAAGEPRPDLTVVLTGANVDRGRYRAADGDRGRERRRGSFQVAPTDDLGRFRFRDLAPGEYEIDLMGPDRGTLTKKVEIPADADRLDVELRPDAGVGLTIRVVEDRSAPVEGATVHVYWQNAPRPGQHSERTDSDGRARFHVPAEVPDVYVSVRPPDGAALLPATTRSRTDGGERRIVLERAAAIAGLVLGLDGKPLAHAAVAARWSEEGSTTVATGADGRFSVLAPVDSRVDLRLTGQVGKGRAPIGGAATVAAGRTDVVIRAERIATDRTLRVRVLTPDGEPVAGVRLTLAGPGHGLLRTDDAGTATFRGLPARETTLMLAPPFDHPAFDRYAEPERVTVVPEGQEVMLRFREGVPISGTVIDRDGEAVRALVVATDPDGRLLGQQATDPKGAFSIVVPKDHAGAVTLAVQAAARPGPPGKPILRPYRDTRIENVAPGSTGVRVVLEKR